MTDLAVDEASVAETEDQVSQEETSGIEFEDKPEEGDVPVGEIEVSSKNDEMATEGDEGEADGPPVSGKVSAEGKEDAGEEEVPASTDEDLTVNPEEGEVPSTAEEDLTVIPEGEEVPSTTEEDLTAIPEEGEEVPSTAEEDLTVIPEEGEEVPSTAEEDLTVIPEEGEEVPSTAEEDLTVIPEEGEVPPTEEEQQIDFSEDEEKEGEGEKREVPSTAEEVLRDIPEKAEVSPTVKKDHPGTPGIVGGVIGDRTTWTRKDRKLVGERLKKEIKIGVSEVVQFDENALDENEPMAEEEEEKEEKKYKLIHHILEMCAVPNRKEIFELSDDYMLRCVEKLTDGQRELVLRGNDLILDVQRRLEDEDMDIVTQFLLSHPSVTTLDLAYNNISDYGFYTIVRFLEDACTIKRLNVMNNDICYKAMDTLAEMENMPLEILRVSGNPLEHEGGEALSPILTADNNLLYLDIAQTSQRLSSLMYFVDAMTTNTRLLYLNMSCPLGEPMIGFDSGHWADSIGRMLELNNTLRELYLEKCNFSCHDMERLMRGMKYNRTLLLLDLSANNIGNRGADVLAKYLGSRPALVALILGHNIITDIGASYICRDMPSSRLQMLDLTYNRLTDKGVLELLSSLRKAVMLRALYLWGNSINHSSCIVLRRMLHSTTLQPDGLDIEVYNVDGVYYAAYRPVDRSNALFYCVPDVRFHRWRWPPPKHRSPAPQIARTCPRRPWAERNHTMLQRCPETGVHARVHATTRRCHF